MSNYYKEARDRMKNSLENESLKIEGSFCMDNINAVALEFQRFKTMEIDTIYDDVFLDTATGLALDLKAKEYFEERKEGENDEDFRQRIFEKIRKRISSGNKNHYKYWAKQIEGIKDAKVLPLANGNGTVKVIVLSNDYGLVSEEVLEKVREHIEKNRPVGASVEVVSAKAKEITINLNLLLSSDSDFVKENISEKIRDYIKEITFDESKIFSYYKVGDIVFDVEGVIDILDYTINGDKKSINSSFEEFFSLSEVTINGS